MSAQPDPEPITPVQSDQVEREAYVAELEKKVAERGRVIRQLEKRTEGYVTPVQLMDNLAVRRYVGRKVRDDHRMLTTEALLRYRMGHEFPAPLKTPGVSKELWRRRDVEEWVKARAAGRGT